MKNTMAENMTGDIISDHRERMLNLKKYYPFFRLIDTSFSNFKDGKYEILDMGYIVMAVLRFFIEENNFKEKDVTYPEYLDFLRLILKRDFGLDLNEQDSKEIADYIFDKIKNDGRPFEFSYFDPVDRKKRVSRMKIIESSIRDNTVWYSISPDAIEFYLDTKEIKDESSISRLLPPPLARSYIVFWQLKRITKSSYTCVPKLYLTLLTLILLICGIASSIHKFGKSSSVIIKIILYKTSESVCRIISVLTLN